MANIGVSRFIEPTTQSRRQVETTRQFTELPSPMKAKAGSEADLQRNSDWSAETKWDGTRTYVVKRGKDVRLFVARGAHNEYTARYPNVIADGKKLKCRSCILDGEFVFFDARGRNDYFLPISARPETVGSRKHKFMAFDILEKDGQSTRNLGFRERKRILDEVIPDSLTIIKETQLVTSNKERFYREQLEGGREGVMLKQKDSTYVPGARSPNWLKVKREATIDVIVKGSTQGTGERRQHFGALHMFYPVNGRLKHIGDVGTGFNNADLARVSEILRSNRPFVIELKFMEWTPYNKVRFPVFKRLRPDKTPQEVLQG